MPQYICKSPIKKDRKRYEPGELIELTLEQAQAMPNAVEPYFHTEPEPMQVVAAVPELQPKGLRTKAKKGGKSKTG